MRRLVWSCLVVLSTLCANFTASAARADESYYMILLTYEGRPGAAREAHTFALFVKTEGAEGASLNELTITTHSISWLPASLDIRLLRPPETGVNLGFQETLDLAAARGARTTAWGPYRIRKELYDGALAQIKRLESGEVAYKAIDRRFRPGNAVNCFHAVSDIVDGPLLDTGSAFGASATSMVRSHLSRWIMDNGATQRWLIERMGLDNQPITFIEERKN